MSAGGTSPTPSAPRRVPVTERPVLAHGHDYADAFETRFAQPDPRTAEQVARALVERAPWAVRTVVSFVHRRLLGFELGPGESSDHLLGWRIVSATPDEVTLVAESTLARGVVLLRTPEPAVVRLITFVTFRRPTARILWWALAPVHRAAAAYLLKREAAGGRLSDPTRVGVQPRVSTRD